ncbi:MAG: AraC family transcriptional regulator [Clostridia bacterium]|nr:AraC family transcriptional regulator [Clostridia bacterium]
MTAGFSSAATFYRYFKSHFGMSPKDYVKNPKTQNIRQISNQISAH